MAVDEPDVPHGHGEVLTRPAYGQWADLMRANAALAAAWRFDVAGTPVRELRGLARREAAAKAREFSTRLGVPVTGVDSDYALIAMTGHQPQLYHPGVWVKDFLLQRVADETGALAIDCVVDSDEFNAVEVHSPCLRPNVMRCHQYLAVGGQDTCYACAPVPSEADLETFCAATADSLSTLRAPAIGRHFARFCDALRSARPDARDLAEFVTFARRRYEAAAGTDYLELKVTAECRSASFATFFADVALRAEEFADVHNGELAGYRQRNRLRSKARPFPDLRRDGELIELPFWHIGARRAGAWARRDGDGVTVLSDGDVLLQLPAEPAAAATVASAARLPLAPKAVTLTIFNRVFVADLFIHGTGGARYDAVTDAIIRRFYGIEPPRFAVASMTMYLPLGFHAVTADEVDAAEQKLNRLAHNPDQLLDEWAFEDPSERAEAFTLAEEKGALTASIREPGADKKAIGIRIREVNERLGALLAPFAAELERELASLREQAEAADIMTDRTYPFCFWDPSEVADKVR